MVQVKQHAESASGTARHVAARLRRWPHLAPLIIVLVYLAIGLSIAGDYGRSIDEYVHHVYAEQTLEVYFGQRHPAETISNLRFYGPAFSVVAEVFAQAVSRLKPDWELVDGRHFSYFVSFLSGSIGLYWLSRRYLSKSIAIATILVFLSQPLLFGQSFINPKDIPFMSFFVLAVAAGFTAVSGLDAIGNKQINASASQDSGGGPDSPDPSRYGLKARRSTPKPLGFAIIIVAILVTLDAFVFKASLRGIESLISAAYGGQAWGPVNRMFAVLAEDAWKTPLTSYVAKVNLGYAWLRYLWTAFIWVSALWMLDWLIFGRQLTRWIDKHRAWAMLTVAGALLGFASAIRVGGLFAGVLVSTLLLARSRHKAVFGLGIYWLVAGLTAYLAWPYLWGQPVQGLLATVEVAINFDHRSMELFFGGLYDSSNLPLAFVPVLLAIQFTEPVVVLSILGIGIIAVGQIRKNDSGLELRLLLAWLVAPIFIQVLLRSTLYNNFRQLLFITPPIFIFAGIGLQKVTGYMQTRMFRIMVLSAFILPGLISIWKLHPYQYVYYNTLVGGVAGAFERFEMDYWCTSYRQAIEYVNDVAPPRSKVGVHWFPHLVSPYARPDLIVFVVKTEHDVQVNRPDFVLACSVSNSHLRYFVDLETIHEVGTEGAVFTLVKSGAK